MAEQTSEQPVKGLLMP